MVQSVFETCVSKEVEDRKFNRVDDIYFDYEYAGHLSTLATARFATSSDRNFRSTFGLYRQ